MGGAPGSHAKLKYLDQNQSATALYAKKIPLLSAEEKVFWGYVSPLG